VIGRSLVAGLCLSPRPTQPKGRLDLTGQLGLASDVDLVIAAPGHPLAGARRVSLARLADEPFILCEPGSGTRETAEEALPKTGRPVQVAMDLASSAAIKRAVARGLGVAIFSRYAVSVALRLGVVVELPVTGFPLRRHRHLVYPPDRRFGPVGEAFLSFVDAGRWRDAVGENLMTD